MNSRSISTIVDLIQFASVSFLIFMGISLTTVIFGYPLDRFWLWVVLASALAVVFIANRLALLAFIALNLALLVGSSNWLGGRDFVGLGVAELLRSTSIGIEVPRYSEMLEAVEIEAAEATGELSKKVVSKAITANASNFENYPLQYPIFWGDDNFPRFLVIPDTDAQAWRIKELGWMGSKSTLLDWTSGKIVYFDRGKQAVFSASVTREFDLVGERQEFPTQTAIHHWGSVWQDSAYLSGVTSRSSGELRALFPNSVVADCPEGSFRGEVVEIVDLSTGNTSVFELTEILASIDEVHWRPEHVMSCDDPLHLNDVIVLKDQRDADLVPGAKPGDFLVSLRANNVLMLVSRETSDVLWYSIGVGSGQHSPKLKGAYLFSFDNSGSSASNGMTEIDSINVLTGAVNSYRASGRDVLYARSRGRIQLTMADPNAIYIQEQRAGAKNKRLSKVRYPETGGRLLRVECKTLETFDSCTQHTIFDFGRGGTNYTILDDPHFLGTDQ